MKYVLGADLGTTAIKAALFDEQGRTVATSTREYSLNTPSPLEVELDPEVYWQAFKAAVAGVLAGSGVQPQDIPCLGISAQGETLIVVDQNGQPLRPAIVWMDNRAQAESDDLAACFTNETIHRVTGQVSMLPMWPAAKILWIRRHEPSIFGKAARFLLIEDYLVFRLTGSFVSEGSLLCSTTYWDLNTRRYWPEMLRELGIDEGRLPEVREPGEAIARIDPTVARELGLSSQTIVATGALDQAAGAIGVGNVRPGVFSECTGSNVAVVALVERPTIDPARQLPCFYYGLPERYMMHAFSMTGGMVLRWFRDNFFRDEPGGGTAERGGAYDRMTSLAASVPAGASGLVLLPHFQGAGPPESNPKARGVLYGLSLHHTRAHVVRAIMESIAMILRRMIEAVEAMGIRVSEVRSLGGGAKSPLWCQIKADVVGRPVYTMKNTEDAACLGAAVLAGAAVGVWPSVPQAIDAIVEIDQRYDPNLSNRGLYDEAYAIYTGMYSRLEPLFARGVPVPEVSG
ncbi:MAG: hypothetical protein JW820_12595 [Spirochaetales bacterium]|nr:hypothetical protein [Spirochaetales bacterium]